MHFAAGRNNLHQCNLPLEDIATVRLGEIYMTAVSSLVRNVFKHTGKNLISRLNILDHGSEYGIQIGNDVITLAALPKYEPTLNLLKGHFTKEGFVHLQHCKIGKNGPLLIQLAKIFGVSVYAGTGNHNSVYRFNFGDYVRALPNGKFLKDVSRP